MEITNRFKSALAAFRKTNNDSEDERGIADGNAFLRYGSRRMPASWSTPDITDKDFYTGYGFAVINKRANRSVVLGKKFLFTDAKDGVAKKANTAGTDLIHPYLSLIRESIDFSERDFWYNISTYLDLEGIYYLMAVRTVTANGKVGNIQKFSLLNPYWVKPIVNGKGDLGGYVENNPLKGQRDIPKEMIIPIMLLNPFDPTKPYALADAARDSQFTLKQANDYARESINGNINAPGILSSAIELPDDQFDNFVSRVKNHGRGEPLFGNGSGTVSWVDMQTDLDKAALDKINSINRDVLLAISGLSKTGVGVEESGTGREVSRTQKDDFTENAIMPQIENIIDALNLDYRRFYNDQWTKNNYSICLDNPLETSHDAELVDVDIRDSQFALFQTLVNKGYDFDLAAKYSKGLIDITELGEPTNPPEPVIPLVPPVPPIDPTQPTPPLPADTPPADPTPPAKPAPTKKPVKPPVPPKKTKKTKASNELKVIRIKNQLAASDIPGLYEDLDIVLDDLGCIMLDTEKLPVTEYVPDAMNDVDDEDDLAGELDPHVTLLFGLLENGNVWQQKVDSVLKGWKCDTVTINEVSYFDLGAEYAIVGLVEKSKELIDGHERLTLLPHINTFSEYIPHITLAYVKHDDAVRDKWVKNLNEQYAGAVINTTELDYGDLPDLPEDSSEDISSENNSSKKFDVYEGYPIPLLQYLDNNANQITPLSEKGSFIYSTETVDKVTIDRIEDQDNSLIAIVDDNTFIKLGEFSQNADRVAILSKLNKRYKNQLVAVKKKYNLGHNHDDDVYDIINNSFDKQTNIESSTRDLQAAAKAAEDKLYQWYVDEISGGDINPHPTSLESFINSLTLPFAVYFTVLFPLYASYRVGQTAKELGITDELPVVALTQEVKQRIDEFARKEAESHMNTLKTDIENALALIRSKTSDPAEIKRQFAAAFKEIQTRRAVAIANNAAARIFNISQYEADLQFLTRAGLIDQAYKVLFSLTGDPCPFCASIIEETNASPIPFTQNFANLGDSIEADGQKFTFNYEPIEAGNVHPNCRCVYRLIVENNVA